MPVSEAPFLLKLGWLVGLTMAHVGAVCLGWRVGDIILMSWRERRRRRRPGYPYKYGIPPGWVVYQHLDEYMSTAEVARRCGCSARLIREIIGGKAPLEGEMAHQLGCLVGVPASTLISMEAAYRRRLAREAENMATAPE